LNGMASGQGFHVKATARKERDQRYGGVHVVKSVRQERQCVDRNNEPEAVMEFKIGCAHLQCTCRVNDSDADLGPTLSGALSSRK
jgi:hypothetical protein